MTNLLDILGLVSKMLLCQGRGSRLTQPDLELRTNNFAIDAVLLSRYVHTAFQFSAIRPEFFPVSFT